MPAIVEKDGVRTGVYVCHCGSNIAGVIDCESVADYSGNLSGVVVSKQDSYLCSEPGQNLIKEDIKQHKLNRIVVASCSPRLHEPTFRQCLQDAGLNPYLLEMVNLREQCSWVHSEDPEGAVLKAKDLVASALARSNQLEAFEEDEVPVTQSTLVIGGGVAGIQAALDLADSGYEVILVDKKPSIGGIMAGLDKSFPTMDCSI
jgi:heterodisulfide reductase subunit A